MDCFICWGIKNGIGHFVNIYDNKIKGKESVKQLCWGTPAEDWSPQISSLSELWPQCRWSVYPFTSIDFSLARVPFCHTQRLPWFQGQLPSIHLWNSEFESIFRPKLRRGLESSGFGNIQTGYLSVCYWWINQAWKHWHLHNLSLCLWSRVDWLDIVDLNWFLWSGLPEQFSTVCDTYQYETAWK